MNKALSLRDEFLVLVQFLVFSFALFLLNKRGVSLDRLAQHIHSSMSGLPSR